jgi:hypothetical protein
MSTSIALEAYFSRDSLPVCLRNENPDKLVSLWEMLKLVAADFMWIGTALQYLSNEMGKEAETEEMPLSYQHSVAERLTEIAARCQLLELPVSRATTEYWAKEFESVQRKYLEGKCAIEEIERTIRHEWIQTRGPGAVALPFGYGSLIVPTDAQGVWLYRLTWGKYIFDVEGKNGAKLNVTA